MPGENYALKYLKYKQMYLDLKHQLGGMPRINKVGLNPQGDKIDIMLFKADWSGHCTAFKPTWEQLKNSFNKKFNFITYDHANDTDMITQMKVSSFPTIIFKDGKETQIYNGPREYEVLEPLLSNLVKIDLHANNLNKYNNEMTGGSSKKDIILFKAEWCGHCNQFKSTWSQLKNVFNKKFNFITYDHAKDSDIMKTLKVDSFPTIMFKNGQAYTSYDGSRKYEEMHTILTNL